MIKTAVGIASATMAVRTGVLELLLLWWEWWEWGEWGLRWGGCWWGTLQVFAGEGLEVGVMLLALVIRRRALREAARNMEREEGR